MLFPYPCFFSLVWHLNMVPKVRTLQKLPPAACRPPRSLGPSHRLPRHNSSLWFLFPCFFLHKLVRYVHVFISPFLHKGSILHTLLCVVCQLRTCLGDQSPSVQTPSCSITVTTTYICNTSYRVELPLHIHRWSSRVCPSFCSYKQGCNNLRSCICCCWRCVKYNPKDGLPKSKNIIFYWCLMPLHAVLPIYVLTSNILRALLRVTPQPHQQNVQSCSLIIYRSD